MVYHAPMTERDSENGRRWNELIGPFWTTSKTARELGLSEEEIEARLADKLLLGLQTKDEDVVLPSFQFMQFEDDKWTVLPGLDQVLKPFKGVTTHAMDWTLASWLNNAERPEFEGKSIIEYLKEGNDVSLPVAMAQATAERWVH